MVGTTQHELPVGRTPLGVVWLKEIGAVLAQAPKTASKHARIIVLITILVFANLAGRKIENNEDQTRFFRRTSVMAQLKKPPANGTFGFCRHTSQGTKNQKSHFFANALTPYRPKNLS